MDGVDVDDDQVNVKGPGSHVHQVQGIQAEGAVRELPTASPGTFSLEAYEGLKNVSGYVYNNNIYIWIENEKLWCGKIITCLP